MPHLLRALAAVALPFLLGGLPLLADDEPSLTARATQFDPTLSSVDIDWTTTLPAVRIEVVRTAEVGRDVVVGSADPETGFLTDTAPGFGSHRYTVLAYGAQAVLERTVISISVRPASLPGVFCTQPDPTVATVHVEWTPPMEYDEIRVRHRGNVIQTLSGRANRTVVDEVARGVIQITVCGVVDGVESVATACRSRLVAPPEKRFTVRAKASEGTYDPETGAGSVSVTITAQEDGATPGEGTPVQGMQIATGYDPSLVTPVSIEPGPALSSPDFFDGQLLDDGVTVGVVLDFTGQVTLDLSSEKEVAVATYEVTVPVGSSGVVESEIGFRNGIGTGAPIDTTIVVGGKSVRPSLIDAVITLRPKGGVLFRRGDIASDGRLDLDDVGELVVNLVAPAEARPLDDCLDASDLDDSGTIDLVDLAVLVARIFGEWPPLPAPAGAGCGNDPTIDPLPCRNAPACAP